MDQNEEQRSVEYQSSETAISVAFLRSLAYHEGPTGITGPDSLAELFLDDTRKRILNDPAARKAVMQTRIKPGMYAFTIARTFFFDDAFRNELDAGIPQIVLLGAGYDSRYLRFKEHIRQTRIFEMDALPTQNRKKEILRKAGQVIPAEVSFVPVNFEKDDLGTVLADAGYKKQERTLFLWEGVTYYLEGQTVDNMLRFISTKSPAGSRVCFDFAALSRSSSGEEPAEFQRATSRHPGEPVKFGIMEARLKDYLLQRGFDLLECLGPEEMRARYLRLKDGSFAGETPSHLRLACASVA